MATGTGPTTQARQDDLRAALGHVMLPEGGDLAASDRVGNIAFAAGGKVSFSIRVTAEEAPAFSQVRKAAESAALSLPGIERALVVLTAERIPQQPPQLKAPQRAARESEIRQQQPGPSVMPEVGAVIAVASGKGGVGKSTTTISLALALRQQGLRVGILDADVYGPSIPTLLGLTGKPRMAADGRRLRPMSAWGIDAVSVGSLVDPDTAMIWRGPMITSAITQLVAEVDWGQLDVVLIDMPPGTGDAQLAVAQNSPLKAAVIVSTPQDLALIDARRGITMFQKLDVPVLGVIENMSQFICPDCGSRHEIFGHGGAEAEARRIGVPFLGAIPLTMDLRRSADLGRPLVATDPEGPVGLALAGIANRLMSQMKNRGLFARSAPAKGVFQ